jgi:hypothetical protein
MIRDWKDILYDSYKDKYDNISDDNTSEEESEDTLAKN